MSHVKEVGTRKKLNNWNFWSFLFNLSAKEQRFCRPISSVSPQRLGICLRLVRATTHHVCMFEGGVVTGSAEHWHQGDNCLWLSGGKVCSSGSRSTTCQANQYGCKNKSGLGRDGNIHLSTKEKVDFFHFLSQLGPSASAVRTQFTFRFLCLSSDWNGSTSSSWQIRKKNRKCGISLLFTASCCLFQT